MVCSAASHVGGDSGSPINAAAGKPVTVAQKFVEKDDDRGQLADSASSVLMEILYAVRMARFDLLRAVQGLAKHFPKRKKTT